MKYNIILLRIEWEETEREERNGGKDEERSPKGIQNIKTGCGSGHGGCFVFIYAGHGGSCRGCRIYKTETGGEEKDVVLQQKVKEDIHSEGEV